MTNDDLIGKHLIFYDGICSLCNRSIIFAFKHDKNDYFRVIQLQSKQTKKLLKKYPEFNIIKHQTSLFHYQMLQVKHMASL